MRCCVCPLVGRVGSQDSCWRESRCHCDRSSLQHLRPAPEVERKLAKESADNHKKNAGNEDSAPIGLHTCGRVARHSRGRRRVLGTKVELCSDDQQPDCNTETPQSAGSDQQGHHTHEIFPLRNPPVLHQEWPALPRHVHHDVPSPAQWAATCAQVADGHCGDRVPRVVHQDRGGAALQGGQNHGARLAIQGPVDLRTAVLALAGGRGRQQCGCPLTFDECKPFCLRRPRGGLDGGFPGQLLPIEKHGDAAQRDRKTIPRWRGTLGDRAGLVHVGARCGAIDWRCKEDCGSKHWHHGKQCSATQRLERHLVHGPHGCQVVRLEELSSETQTREKSHRVRSFMVDGKGERGGIPEAEVGMRVGIRCQQVHPLFELSKALPNELRQGGVVCPSLPQVQDMWSVEVKTTKRSSTAHRLYDSRQARTIERSSAHRNRLPHDQGARTAVCHSEDAIFSAVMPRRVSTAWRIAGVRGRSRDLAITHSIRRPRIGVAVM